MVARYRRDAKLATMTRIRDMLERGTWPTGLPLTDRDRRGLERTLDAVKAELRELVDLEAWRDSRVP